MDQRHVFSDDKELLSIITLLAKEKQKASLLVDRAGLTRVEGVIASIDQSDNIGNATIHLDNRELILLKEIIGINGIFRSDYSEC